MFFIYLSQWPWVQEFNMISRIKMCWISKSFTATAVAPVLEHKIRKLVTMMIPAVKIVQHGFLFVLLIWIFES